VNLTSFLMLALGLLVGALLGVLLYAAWLRNKTSASLRLPDKWPLTARVMVTNQEHEVLAWLRATFHDHLVMVKLPVLRFMAPTDKEKNGGGSRWQEILGGVYCTFTVCTTDGNVVGCVDVLGKRGMNKASRDLKNSLLSDCRIAYTVVRSSALPKGTAMRAAFLGEMQIEDQVESEETRGGDSSFHADLDSFTRQKRLAAKEAALRELNKGSEIKSTAKQPAGFNPDGTGAFGPGAFGPGAAKSHRGNPQFEDSFTFTDESRPAKLS
jgi:hypothetical protein